eukprot:4567228-Amphidinium_carterae.1
MLNKGSTTMLHAATLARFYFQRDTHFGLCHSFSSGLSLSVIPPPSCPATTTSQSSQPRYTHHNNMDETNASNTTNNLTQLHHTRSTFTHVTS